MNVRSGCLVAEDIGAHQLERLVELLTSKECEDLLLALSHPEENIFQRIDRLSPEKNQLDVKPRAKRDTSSAAGYSEHHLTHISHETWAKVRRVSLGLKDAGGHYVTVCMYVFNVAR